MTKKIAVCFHLGYNNCFDQFTQYIDNILIMYPMTDIYISYREEQDPTQMCLTKYPRAKLIKAINGCDTGAFLLQIKLMIESNRHYDYVFKLHTKSNNKVFPHWREDLLNDIAGSPSNVKKIVKTLSKNKKIGMIGSQRWLLHRDINFDIFKELCQRNNVSTSGKFIGGTIFWVKFDVIKKMFKHIDINREYSLCERGKPSEPSYTHSWERVYGLMVNTCGYKIHGV